MVDKGKDYTRLRKETEIDGANCSSLNECNKKKKKRKIPFSGNYYKCHHIY